MPYDPANHQPNAFERRISALVGSRLFWCAVVLGAVAIPLGKALQTELPAVPPKIRQIPNFTLLDQDGKPFGAEQLRGKLWVANFVYTSCSTVCPKLTKAMQTVQYRARNMKGFVHLASFTVDPKHDTPPVLYDFAKRNHALGNGDWSFVTGELEPLRQLVKHGFGLGMDRHDDADVGVIVAKDPAMELFDISHGQQLVLVDPEMWIRGLYDPDKPGLDRLLCDMGLVANVERNVRITPASTGAAR